jgi:pyruvate dehydrogenase E2 component (dihydrolipoamide acetyltransferase)
MADVIMPQMGESIVEGTLTKWLKKVGDKVERDEPLFEISTDKVDTEIPSPASGTLTEILVQEGATVAINTIVARVGDGAAQPAPAPAPVQPVAAAAPAAPAAPARLAMTGADSGGSDGGGAGAPGTGGAAAAMAFEEPPSEPADDLSTPVSPLVRRMARENNIDLKTVKGTGAGGRITKQDLENLLAARTSPSAAPSPAPTAEPTPLPRVSPAKTRVEPMSGMRQKIAEHMVVSIRTSAHVTTVHRVDVTKIAKLRDRIKGEFQQRYGYALTFLPFFARAAAEALREFPIVNSSIEGTNILYHNEINIGIAVALDNGLIVPVIKHADEMNVVGLQRAIVDLAARARGKQLKPDEVQGGTFSITNFGSFGSIFATPVINQPQIAILGVGAVEKQPVVIDDAIAIRSMAHLALTFDHRLIDGALADQFCQKVKAVLENWSDQVL